MFTSYDQIWQTFLDNCKRDDIDLPSTDEKIYSTIQNAVLHFNNRLREKVKCSDADEQLDVYLSEDYLLILAHYIRLIFLKNEKTYFEGIWQPFQNDIGLRNFSSQLNSLKDSIAEQEKLIERMIMNQEDDYL